MQLHRLRLVNFRQHAETELLLGPGLTAIVGPNGSGKTTLLEGLAWALYGNVAARGTRDSLRRYGAPVRAPVRVEVEFTLGAHEYRVVRTLYGAELYQDGGEGAIANSHQAVSAKIAHVLGMSHDEFFNTYFTGQKELAVMATMGPTERGKFLSRLLGYEKLRQAQHHLRQRRSTLRAEVAGVEQGLEDPERLHRERAGAGRQLKKIRKRAAKLAMEHAEAAKELASSSPGWKRVVEAREATLAMDGDRRIAEQLVHEARREFQRLDRDLAATIVARNKLATMAEDLARARTLEVELEHLDRDFQQVDQRRVLKTQMTEVGQQIGRIEERLRSDAGLEDAHREAREAVDRTRAALDELRQQEERVRTTWVRDRQDAETKRSALLDQYGDLQNHRKRIEEAGSNGQCPTCTRPLGSEYESVLETLATQLEEIKVNGRYYKARVTQLEREPEELVSALAEYAAGGESHETSLQHAAELDTQRVQRRESERELAAHRERVRGLEAQLAGLTDTYDVERHDVVRKEMRKLERVLREATRLQVESEHAERLVRDAEVAEQLLSEREERVRHLTEALAAFGFSEAAYEQARKRQEQAERALRDVELQVETVKGDEKAARVGFESIERRIHERDERAAKSAELRRDLALHDELDKALEGLRGELNAKLRPDLSEIGSAFVDDLTEGRYSGFELDEHYEMRVLEDGVPRTVISGGEEDIVNLALRLAISQMVADRAGQPLSLLVLDEIFGGLDASRRQGVIDLLRKLGDRFPQVLFVTHIESVKEGADQVFHVSLDESTQTSVISAGV